MRPEDSHRLQGKRISLSHLPSWAQTDVVGRGFSTLAMLCMLFCNLILTWQPEGETHSRDVSTPKPRETTGA